MTLCRKRGRGSGKKIMFISPIISTPNLFHTVIFFYTFVDIKIDLLHVYMYIVFCRYKNLIVLHVYIVNNNRIANLYNLTI